jgi:hypothetical protein
VRAKLDRERFYQIEAEPFQVLADWLLPYEILAREAHNLGERG